MTLHTVQEYIGNSAAISSGLVGAGTGVPDSGVLKTVQANNTVSAAAQPKMDWTIIIVIVLVIALIIFLVLKK